MGHHVDGDLGHDLAVALHHQRHAGHSGGGDLDQRAEDYPVTRLKFGLLVFVVPLVGMALGLQVAYFLGLRPEIITSCCGSPILAKCLPAATRSGAGK